MVGNAAESKGLELIVDIDVEVPGHLIGDALRIGQILINFPATPSSSLSGERSVCGSGPANVTESSRNPFRGRGQRISRRGRYRPGFLTPSSNWKIRSLGDRQLVISRNLAELMGGKVGGYKGLGSTFLPRRST